MPSNLHQRYLQAVNRLAKWRSVFAGRWLGTRAHGDPESESVRDVYEKLLLMRAELNALVALLSHKGVIDTNEFRVTVIEECDHLQGVFERQFPGFKAEDYGMSIDASKAAETTKGWPL